MRKSGSTPLPTPHRPANPRRPRRITAAGGSFFCQYQHQFEIQALFSVSLMMFLVIGLAVAGCGRKGGSGGSAATNLSVTVWPSFPPTAYRHIEHLQQLQTNANILIATNPAILSQWQARGNLAENSPLRVLLNIPTKEPATVLWSETSDHRFITVQSAKSQQRLGRIKFNHKTGLVESAHDVEALFVISEIERRLRQIVGTRAEALRLFHGGLPKSPSQEQQQATKALAAALFLPQDTKALSPHECARWFKSRTRLFDH